MGLIDNSKELNSICAYILSKGEITRFKLQKLLYFIQASSLIYLEREAFREDFEAWNLGTVIPNLNIDSLTIDKIEDEIKELIDIIWENLGHKTAYELVDILCSYSSWRETWERGGGGVIPKCKRIKCHREKYKNGFIF